MNKIESINLIYRNPEVRGGRPCIVGTGLRVMDIVNAMRWNGRSPEQMADAYQISLGQVHAALAYYYCNQAEIDADISESERKSQAIAEKVLADKSSLYSRLQRYMQNDDFRAALSEAIEASDENRTARIRALFAKMDAKEQEVNAFPTARSVKSLE
ncbi:MAG: DUF433 domain-containing protein [Chloroflexota bacterium]|nr:DUF433 domain-containing protein [Chloroflexota bacterium]MDE2947872.1 DUF433 domain-containing protein [Chloroflexota bacterium]